MNVAEAKRHAINELELALAHLVNASQLLGLANIRAEDLSGAELKLRSQLLAITFNEQEGPQ